MALLELSEKVSVHPDVEKVFLVCGACKTGTSLHLNVFGNSGIHSYNNPIKTVFQYSLIGTNPSPVELGMRGASEVMVKESLGSTSEEESTLNPLKVLIDSGVNPASISLLLTKRETWESALSWHRAYGHMISNEVIVRNLSLATATANCVLEDSRKLGIKSKTIHYSTFGFVNPNDVIAEIFNYLGIAIRESTNSNWPPMINNQYIHFFKKPDRFQHKIYKTDTVNTLTSIRHVKSLKDEFYAAFSPAQIAEIEVLAEANI